MICICNKRFCSLTPKAINKVFDFLSFFLLFFTTFLFFFLLGFSLTFSCTHYSITHSPFQAYYFLSLILSISPPLSRSKA